MQNVKSLTHKVIRRLFLAWLVLSVVIGGAVYLVEEEKVDRMVTALAFEEAGLLKEDFREFLDCDDAALQAGLEKKLRSRVGRGQFLTIELYDSDKRLRFQVTQPGGEAAEEAAEHPGEKELMGKSPNYRKFSVGNQRHLQVFVPLMADGAVRGYLEGVYRVSARTEAEIRNRIAWTMGFVLAAILVTTVALYPVIMALNRDLIKHSLELSQSNAGMLEVLGAALSKRDSGTSEHSYRVTLYSLRIAEVTGLEPVQMPALIKGALLHDVGKIAIRDQILLKEGKMTAEEFAVMKTHVRHGMDIISRYPWLRDAGDVVLYHHEKYDGSGYMAGLRGEDIPLNARIFAIADVFDALTTKRPYKEPLPFDACREHLLEQRGKHFDPRLVEAFDRIVRSTYDEIAGADEEGLKGILGRQMATYFPA